mgnify:FL=1
MNTSPTKIRTPTPQTKLKFLKCEPSQCFRINLGQEYLIPSDQQPGEEWIKHQSKIHNILCLILDFNIQKGAKVTGELGSVGDK